MCELKEFLDRASAVVNKWPLWRQSILGASPIEVEYRIREEINKGNYDYGLRKTKLEILRTLNHGHKFGRDWQCNCGLTVKSYHLNFQNDLNHHCCLRTLEDMQEEYNGLHVG